ncbi:filamentous hemagglutinin N-terminal domain-containing protein [Aetokthonos hydrillicola Thurmond2011]|jgi:filamentous hemagglutinin family protein|uniref:Filamentous hemagglutinin N-terminal domain-containing protein n=1 Tax=Aetokthonos hydrillicola Thurmond2011 TaxID=2712845 RepID=A0AAP5IE63_9CYAN|nr:filamentous hemagglutinin N-terminal domain-containing protein [Aetokthonos hydrillicola]MBO3457921.1 filamentous hemagglutinin N-terminal domain-containing protein [Aetokthonos hydrillicola CCALA 1050]MBW4587410.1 filamentous hemagglutinin N-terminal domain-containing protein [Aetokthonos hydrillicola CCALA 1050]MDR9899978.1 filamentous hemagglutinin N-terminal domain-containing protein [Aetokthonos hydrillicola Thurmond2011]
MAKIRLIKYLFRWWSLSGSTALFWLSTLHPITAQIVPDTTLSKNSIVTSSGKINTITGGTQAGGNLFHSFKEFSVSSGSEAHFNNTIDIQNIISRVTGGSISKIDGVIRTNGSANFFFINPSGIIFGPNASLNVGGSFIASTANSLRFADGTEFSAANPQATPLLTVSVPTGLQFGSNRGDIVNQSQASLSGVNNHQSPGGIQVRNGKTLALVGGNVSLDGGNLTVASGRIEIGSVGTGLVNLTEVPEGYALGYAGVQNFQDIQLSKGAQIDTSGPRGGDIHLTGRNISLTDSAAIFSTTQGASPSIGGNLIVNAAEFVNLRNNALLSTSTLNTGSAGNLIISTKKLTVDSGAFIQTPSTGQGSAGNLQVRATDAIELSGTTADGLYPSGLFAQVKPTATGTGGNLTIETGKLTIRDGASVDASTFGAGQAGNVVIKATNVELEGFAPTLSGNSGIFAQVADTAINNAGNAGTLRIETERLTVKNGAQIATTGRKRGNGGDLTIVSNSIELSGALPNATPRRGSSGIFVSTRSPNATGNVGNLNITSRQITVKNGAKIAAENEGTGQGGTLNLNVRQLTIQNGGLVQSGSFAEGSGGTLTVTDAESVQVIGKGTIGSTAVVSTLSAAAEASGKAGNLNITTRRLNVEDGAQVSVSGKGSGSAGSLSITTNDLRLNQGRLTAETNAGEGANITLQNLGLLLLQNQSLISAQAFNNANGGTIKIDAAKGVVTAASDQNNDIIANAFQGKGGAIDIATQGIFGIAKQKATPPNITNDIDASSNFGLAGTVTINTPDVDPSRSLFTLSTGVAPPPRLAASNCSIFANSGGDSFTITGRGGLPPSPYEPLTSDAIWTDTRELLIKAHQIQPNRYAAKIKSRPIEIVPATGWVFNDKGEVTLISSVSNAISNSTPTSCPAR